MLRYALIGKKLGHSFSKSYFENKFLEQALITCSYENIEMDEINRFEELDIKKFSGFNVTIPYKESIIPKLDSLDNVASEVKAVNTIKVTKEGEAVGYNTDIYGFSQSIKPFLASGHQRALILGTGGASKAVAYVFKELGIDFLFVSRKETENQIINWSDVNEYVMKHHQIIVNTTPLGQYPKIKETPDIPFEFLNDSHFVMDLIYNPDPTKLLKLASQKGALTLNGLSMLQHQAEKAWEIWNS